MTWGWWAIWFVFTRVWVSRSVADWQAGEVDEGWLLATVAMAAMSLAGALAIWRLA